MATQDRALLESVLEAHGGLERWNRLDNVSARLIQGGALWALKGQAGVLDDVVVTAGLHEERVSHRPFGAADRHWRTFETPWSTLQLAYFVGTAMWTYLTQPFTFAMPGFQTSVLEPWDEAGHPLARHDYDVEISGGTSAAHYVSDYEEVAGIRLPTKHRIFPCAPDGRSLAEPLVVSIDLSEITFT
jgi:hypothetical protein